MAICASGTDAKLSTAATEQPEDISLSACLKKTIFFLVIGLTVWSRGTEPTVLEGIQFLSRKTDGIWYPHDLNLESAVVTMVHQQASRVGWVMTAESSFLSTEFNNSS